MQIKEGTPVLLLRVNDFGQFKFIDEHEKCLMKQSSVWMLKAGRHLSDKSVRMIQDSGVIILKEQKKSGNRFALAYAKDIKQGRKQNEMSTPEYYKELLNDGFVLEGTWIEITQIDILQEETIQKIVLAKDQQKVIDVVGKTRAPILYCTVNCDVELSK